MKIQTKIAALAITAASLAVSGTAYAATVASDGLDEEPAASVPADANRSDLVAAKTKADRFAVVEWNGTLVHGKNITSVARVGSGSGAYEVIFDRDISQCAYAATIDQSIVANAGEIAAKPRSGNPNGVFISTNDSAGADFDRRFHLTVTC